MLFLKVGPEFFKSCLWKNLAPINSSGKITFFEQLKIAADAGEKEAQADVGMLYEEGIGVNLSFFEAFRYYKLSADQESIKGVRLLSHAYEKGIGVEPSYELFQKYGIEAMHKYREMALKGNNDAMLCLGQEFWEGCGFGVSSEETFAYLSKVANTMDHALALLGLCYEDGIGTKSDLDKAMALYMKSAKKRNPLAMFRAGVLALQRQEFAQFKPEGAMYLRQILQDCINPRLKEMVLVSVTSTDT